MSNNHGQKLAGKIAVITGGSSGIGLATAKRFVAEGAHVVITGRREKELKEAAALIKENVTTVVGDVSRLEDLDRLYAVVRETWSHRRTLRERGRGYNRPTRGGYRGTFRPDLRRERKGTVLYGAEGPSSLQRRWLDYPDLFGLQRVGAARV